MALVGAHAAPGWEFVGVAVAGVVWVLFRGLVVNYEEPLLRRRLGDPFEEYCQRVPRWIPPFG